MTDIEAERINYQNSMLSIRNELDRTKSELTTARALLTIFEKKMKSHGISWTDEEQAMIKSFMI